MKLYKLNFQHYSFEHADTVESRITGRSRNQVKRCVYGIYEKEGKYKSEIDPLWNELDSKITEEVVEYPTLIEIPVG